jgi:hypothetical protein
VNVSAAVGFGGLLGLADCSSTTQLYSDDLLSVTYNRARALGVELGSR